MGTLECLTRLEEFEASGVWREPSHHYESADLSGSFEDGVKHGHAVWAEARRTERAENFFAATKALGCDVASATQVFRDLGVAAETVRREEGQAELLRRRKTPWYKSWYQNLFKNF
jgi:hypothetical protein